MAAFAAEHCGKTCLIISDRNTRAAAGDVPCRALCDAGKSVAEHVFAATALDATQERGDEVVDMAADRDFLVAVGSGTLCDLAKYAGDLLERPVLLFPTAASMNGYTSGIVALKIRGLKRTQTCRPAMAVFADPAVIATAPATMTAAGVGDFLSKCSSSTDWRAAYLLRGGYFCERPREFFETTQERLLAAAPDIGRGKPEAVAVVLEALLLSGLSMVIAGSSAPASGGEHLISHYLDMKHALYGTAHDLHGTQVGVATVHCLGLWERVLDLAPDALDIEALVDAQPSEDQISAWIREDWAETVGAEVQEQWDQKKLSPAQLRVELARVRDTLCSNRAELAKDLLPAATVAAAIAAAGGPVAPEDMTASYEEYQKALHRARYLRNRFTVLDLAAELDLQ
jgi:glycerol-1-phosphate dehydrogenase [NAD(P)+]